MRSVSRLLLVGWLGLVAPRVSAQGPNAPPGYRQITKNEWTELPSVMRGDRKPGQWTMRQETNVALVSDPAVPTALRVMFPAGHRGGTAPQSIRFPFPQPSPGVYIAYQFRASPRFTFNGNVQTKSGWLRRTGDGGSGFIVPQFRRGKGWGGGGRGNNGSTGGGAANPLIPSWNMQGLPNSNDALEGSGGGRDLNDGRWHWIEMQMVASSGFDASDGVGRMWIDGRLYFSYTTVKYFGPRWPGEFSFDHFRIEPTYGGGRNPSPFDQYFDFGPIFISGGER